VTSPNFTKIFGTSRLDFQGYSEVSVVCMMNTKTISNMLQHRMPLQEHTIFDSTLTVTDKWTDRHMAMA